MRLEEDQVNQTKNDRCHRSMTISKFFVPSGVDPSYNTLFLSEMYLSLENDRDSKTEIERPKALSFHFHLYLFVVSDIFMFDTAFLRRGLEAPYLSSFFKRLELAL